MRIPSKHFSYHLSQCHIAVLEIKIRNWSVYFVEDRIFHRPTTVTLPSIENAWDIWLIVLDLGQPNKGRSEKKKEKWPFADDYYL